MSSSLQQRDPFCDRQGLCVVLCALLACGVFSGCAAFTNPVANGIPVRNLPPELLACRQRDAMQTIPLSWLKQKPPEVYRLGPNDVLGVYIEGVLPGSIPGQPVLNPPVYFPSQIDPMSRGLPASLGFPIPIRENGTVSLPLVDPVACQGKTITEAEAAIRDAYIKGGILQPAHERIIVGLMQPRITRVTVIRQEVGGFTSGGLGGVIATSTKRGTGNVVSLRAYENDVLTALADTGGLPGLDAYSEILVFKHPQHNAAVVEALEAMPQGRELQRVAELCPQVIHIPTRVLPGQPLPFRPEDIVLETGDVVFMEARDIELFYTGGLLPPGEFVLPRDYDLDVVKAVLKVQGALINGGYSVNNNVGLLVAPGIGGPSPSLLSVLRKTSNGGQVTIRVDLNLALTDPRERILVQPGDVLILQETPGEAFARYLTHTFNLDVTSELVKTSRTTVTAGAILP